MQRILIKFCTGFALLAAAAALPAAANDVMVEPGADGLPSFISSPGPVVPGNGLIRFDVYRKDSKIGTHRLSFSRNEGVLEVIVDIDLKVDFLFLTVFDYEHRIREQWKDGQLVRLESETEQNGKIWDVEAESERDDFVVNVKKGDKSGQAVSRTLRLDRAHIPTSYWNIELLGADKLFNTQTGELLDVQISEAGYEQVETQGRMVDAVKVTIRGELEVDLWYDPTGELVKLAFSANDGSRIEYKRI